MNKLDDVIEFCGLTAKNRFVVPPLTCGYGTDDGHVTEKLTTYYKARAKSAGLHIVEAAAVSPEGRIVGNGLGLWDDSQIEGQAKLAAEIKKMGANAFIQIIHAGARAIPEGPNAKRITPSGVLCRPGITPVEATVEEIKEVVSDYADAALRAQKAGYDGIELHGAHFYLLSEFLSPVTNTRTDQYGDSVEGRAAFPMEVVKAIREKVGPDFPICFRLHAFENMENGMTTDEAVATGKLLTEVGVDILHLTKTVSGSWNTDGEEKMLVVANVYTKDDVPGAVAATAERFKKACNVPVITVGKLGSRNNAEEALAAGADMIAIGRQMICDPDTIDKIMENREDEILPCLMCGGCHLSIAKTGIMKCAQNKNLPE